MGGTYDACMIMQASSAEAPGIGFVVPMHGEDSLVLETLESLRQQSVRPASVVVVVDGVVSDEESIRSHPIVDRLEVLGTTSGGPATPRNRGFTIIQDDCDAVCFLDHDDLLHPEFVRTAQAALIKEPEADLIAFRFRVWHSDTPLVGLSSPPESPSLEPVGLDDYLACTGSILPSFSVLRNRIASTIRESGTFFDANYPSNQDFDAFVRILSSYSGVCCSWESGWYRVHPASISANAAHAWACRAKACNDLTNYFKARGDASYMRGFRRARATAVRRSARHLWVEGQRGEAIRRLGGEALRRLDIRALSLLLLLGSGLDRKVRMMSSGDPRARRDF